MLISIHIFELYFLILKFVFIRFKFKVKKYCIFNLVTMLLTYEFVLKYFKINNQIKYLS
jgi:hypothetical protein